MKKILLRSTMGKYLMICFYFKSRVCEILNALLLYYVYNAHHDLPKKYEINFRF